MLSGDENIGGAFSNVVSRRDLARWLGIEYKILTYNLYKLPEDSRYKQFEVKKRNGKVRIITAPDSGIKAIQKQLCKLLLDIYPPKACVHGYIKNNSILTNAREHANKRFVINIDLEDFFPSINFGRVRGIFKSHPFYFSDLIATTLAQICCYKGVLPQGAPTSPILSNYVCRKMDNQLMILAGKHKCRYSRYADDITFSTNLREIPVAIGTFNGNKFVLGAEFRTIVESNDFKVNENKIRFAAKNNRQEVTGLIVNEFPNINRKYVRNLRAMIHAWEHYGLEKASQVHYSKFNLFQHNPKNQQSAFKAKLIGRIGFVGFVRGKHERLYHKLRSRIQRLSPDAKLPFTYGDENGTSMINVVSEGKTDPKHLSAAIAELRRAGHFENLTIGFPKPASMNNAKLLQMCESYSSMQNDKIFIAVFDRDERSILKKVTDEQKGYRDWGNHVYSFAIPKPPHRTFDEVCLEHYYLDDELRTVDEKGRRLFLSNEFDKETGKHLSEELTYRRVKILKRTYPFIIDDEVIDVHGTNVALSKDGFATHIVHRVPGYDTFSFVHFKLIFQVIEGIIRDNPK